MSTVLHDVVRVERQGVVEVVTIAHPPVNAINRSVVAGITEAIANAEADNACKAVIITGEGPKFFAAGADIKEFLTLGGDAIVAGQDVTLRMERSRLPIIAAVNGVAFGGGCELALACDVRIASRDAKFAQPEINLGIIPGWGGTQRLPRLIGRSAAVALLLSGDPIDAARAYELGLVAEVVDGGDVLATAMTWAAKLGAKAPLALLATKRALGDGLDRPIDAGLKAEAAEFVSVFGSDDAREGVTAFLEKRAPQWRGK